MGREGVGGLGKGGVGSQNPTLVMQKQARRSPPQQLHAVLRSSGNLPLHGDICSVLDVCLRGPQTVWAVTSAADLPTTQQDIRFGQDDNCSRWLIGDMDLAYG